MRRWIRLAASLYPQAWRDRYGAEFQALLEDLDPGWREFADVVRGALKMQMSTATSYLKIAGATAVAGAIVATAMSFGVPRQYVSEAVVRMTPRQVPEDGGPVSLNPIPPNRDALDNSAGYQFGQLGSDVLSRHSLVDIILEPSLDLYRDERQRVPIEDVILLMKRNIQISPVPVDPSQGGGLHLTAKISFAYRDQEKAQAVVRRLVTRFVVSNATGDENRARTWRQVWPQSDPVPLGEEFEILDPASLPKPVSPNRVAFMAWGLGAGLLLGLLAASAMRRPRWTLQMAGFGAAGCTLAVAVSFQVPSRYTSTAVMRFSRPLVPERLSSEVAGMPAVERFQQLEHEVLSRASLSQIILNPSLNLYQKQRTGTPLEDIIEKMRSRDLRIQVVRPPLGSESAFTISFTDPDRYKASAVVRELVSQFVYQHFRAMHSRAMDLEQGDDVRKALEHKLGQNLEVLDPANVPEIPSGPGRLSFAASGLLLGLLAGALTMWLRRRRSPNLEPA